VGSGRPTGFTTTTVVADGRPGERRFGTKPVGAGAGLVRLVCCATPWLNSLSEIALTKLDVRDTFETPMGVCVAYEADGGALHTFPLTSRCLHQIRPFYE